MKRNFILRALSLIILFGLAGTLAAQEEDSPAVLALEQGDIALAKKLILANRALLDAEGRVSRYAVLSPFFWAVRHGNLELARWLKDQGARVDQPYLTFDREEFTANALALSLDPAMIDYLKSLGLPQQVDVPPGSAPQPWTVNDEGVNLRSSPDTKAAIVTKLHKGDQVRHEGHTTYRTVIGGDDAFWLKIVTKTGVRGWVYGAFLDNPWPSDEE